MNKSKFEAIFQYATEGILTTDKKGVISSVNPSCCRLFGYDEKELLGKKIEILIPKRFKNHKSHRESYVESPSPRSMGKSMDLAALKKNGDEFPVEVSLSPYTNGSEVFIIAFVIDITSRRKNEEREKEYREELENEVEDRTLILKEAIQKLEKTKRNLDEALKRERDLSSMKSKFVSIASHEFRTPLSTMLSSLVLVGKYASRGETTKLTKHIDRIKSNIKGLTEILNDILDLNKLEEGKVKVNSENIILKPQLENILNDLKLVCKDSQELKLAFEFDENTTVFLDKKLLRHITTNLVSNAIKFSPDGTTIQVNVNYEDAFIYIEIIDEGIGIPSENIPKLFTRFYRADNVGQIQGTGLGLSIVQQYAALMGGGISVESEINKGSIFTIQLPVNYNNIEILKE